MEFPRPKGEVGRNVIIIGSIMSFLFCCGAPLATVAVEYIKNGCVPPVKQLPAPGWLINCYGTDAGPTGVWLQTS